ncbi:uncharacterized protein LOC111623313 isoform X1 [Centruroides sculpturatus]|uniref:uncharacterized protein LOC111623313 isoform X1 n=1 Tax=Centruroides sculpturatus TaxID=218467 RepID=UPI000C6E82D1|nr:uncharacterized protein LOC111623313 isoform X1 [Centruroides sculpturatus]
MLSFIAFVFFASSVCIIKVEGNSNCTENLNVCEWLNECCVNIFRERKNNTSSQEMISCLRKKRDETIMEPGKLLKDLVEDYYKINVYEEDIQYGGFVQHSGIVMSNVGSMSTYSNVKRQSSSTYFSSGVSSGSSVSVNNGMISICTIRNNKKKCIEFNENKESNLEIKFRKLTPPESEDQCKNYAEKFQEK